MADQRIQALRKYGVDADVYFGVEVAAGEAFATAVEWTPAAADSKIWKDGGAANPTTNAVANISTTLWRLQLTAAEMSAAHISVHVIDAAGGPAIKGLEIVIETYGHASAQHAADLDDSVRLGLTALPNASAGVTGGVPTLVAAGTIAPDAVATGLANAADTVTQITLTGGSATNNFYVGALVRIISGTGAGQARRVTSYTGATKVALLDAPWITAPDASSTWVLASDRSPDANSSGDVAIGAGGIIPASFTASAIDATVIAPAALTNTKFAAGAIDSAAIAGGAITAATFAAGAIDAAALAAGAGAEIADAVWDEARAGHVGAGSFGEGVLVATGGITAASIATNAVDADALAADAVTEIAAAIPTAAVIADAIWDEARAGHVAGGSFGQGVATVIGSVGSVAAGGITAASFAANALDQVALDSGAANEIADAILARQVPQAVAAVGVVPTVAQLLTAVASILGNKDRVGTTFRYKAVDNVTVLMQFTVNDIDDPTTHGRTA